MKSSLLDIINCIRISKNAFRRIKLNFLWAFLYNSLLVPIAMGIFYPVGFTLDPMFAGIAMALSSVTVVISSLLLKWFTPTKCDTQGRFE
jgi:Cu+-exporting ATPase